MVILKRIAPIMVLVLALSFIAGCAAFKSGATNEERYYAALKWFNDNYEEYLDLYDTMPATVKADWKSSYHPIFDHGDLALKAWSAVLGTETAEGKERVWLTFKKEIIKALFTLGIIEIEGGA